VPSMTIQGRKASLRFEGKLNHRRNEKKGNAETARKNIEGNEGGDITVRNNGLKKGAQFSYRGADSIKV